MAYEGAATCAAAVFKKEQAMNDQTQRRMDLLNRLKSEYRFNAVQNRNQAMTPSIGMPPLLI